jgi:hypothetical protein
MSTQTDAERNGMTEAEFAALSPEARAWRTEHPRTDPPLTHGTTPVSEEPGHAAEPSAVSGAVPASTPGLSPGGQGAQVVLTGDAQKAARGGMHGSIEANTIARDAAIVAGHVVSGTTAAAVEDATKGAPVDKDGEPAEVQS